jgi:hypothetical protein
LNGSTLFVHAARVSQAAVERAAARRAGLRVRHALDESLVPAHDARFEPGETDYARLLAFVRARRRSGDVRAILSCSVYNAFAIRLSADLGLPVERSDAAGAAAAARVRRLALAVSYPPSYRTIETHLLEIARSAGNAIAITPLLGSNAFAGAADSAAYAAALTAAARAAAPDATIFLAQYSMDPHAGAVRAVSPGPVISALEFTLSRLAAGA